MNFGVDYVHGGQAFGSAGVASRLLRNGMNPDYMRPILGRDGVPYFCVRDPHSGKMVKQVANAYTTPAVLLRDEWQYVEKRIIEPILPRLQVIGDLTNAGLEETIPNGMATTEIYTQTEGDAGFAAVSMNGLARSDRDRVEYGERKFPIPIIHGEWSIDLRQLMQSRLMGRGIDTTMGRKVMRRCFEKAENMAIGEATTYKANGTALYGLTTHPNRYTKTLTLPTSAGWTPRVLVDEVIEMIDTLDSDLFNGPFGMYYSPAWQKYMGMDYSDAYPGLTLGKRLRQQDDGAGLSWMRKLEYGLTDYQIIVFQLTEDVVQVLNGMDPRILQWEEKAGWEVLFKCAMIRVTRLQTRENDDLGVVHGLGA